MLLSLWFTWDRIATFPPGPPGLFVSSLSAGGIFSRVPSGQSLGGPCLPVQWSGQNYLQVNLLFLVMVGKRHPQSHAHRNLKATPSHHAPRWSSTHLSASLKTCLWLEWEWPPFIPGDQVCQKLLPKLTSSGEYLRARAGRQGLGWEPSLGMETPLHRDWLFRASVWKLGYEPWWVRGE